MLAAIALPALAAAPSNDTAVKSAQEKFKKNLITTAKFLDSRIKNRVLAAMNVRPELLSDENAANAKHIQEPLMRALWAQGIMVFPAEEGRPIKVKRKKDRLPFGLLFEKEDAQHLTQKKADLLLVPRLKTQRGNLTLRLQIFDLKTVRSIAALSLPTIRVEKVPLREQCKVELLPDLNAAVLSFAASHVGQKVGRGECWDLPATILKSKGVKINGYDFGKKISWEEALPGDVLTTSRHVMVLVKPSKDQKASRILHQNVNNKRFVIIDVLRPRQGLSIWRPGR